MKHFRYLLPFALALSTISCSPEAETGEPYTTSLVSLDGKLVEYRPTVMLIVADDANTADAAQLRERLTQSVRAGLLHIIEERWGSCGSKDPAQWHPSDVRIVVARPSAPDGEALLTPLEIPNLAWITQTSTAEEIDAIVAATTEALGKRLALPGETYRPLHAATRAVDLLFGNRMPSNAAESEFVASLPKEMVLQVVVANSRPDEDMQPLGQLAPVATMSDSIFALYSVIGPSMAGDAACNVFPLGSSRLENWATQLDAEFVAWPCDSQNTWDLLLVDGWADCGPRCQSRPIRVSPDGMAACKVFIDQLDLEKCDAAHGWQDPDGQATFFDRNGTMLRRCEVVQHTGANLDACRTSLECSGCSSGYCVTEVPELVASVDYCNGDEVPWSLRFTGGAIIAKDGWINVTCETGGK